VETNIMREVPSCLSCVAFTVLKLLGLLQSPEKGITSVLDAALAPPVSFTPSNYLYYHSPTEVVIQAHFHVSVQQQYLYKQFNCTEAIIINSILACWSVIV
jgi:hypothetical protein